MIVKPRSRAAMVVAIVAPVLAGTLLPASGPAVAADGWTGVWQGNDGGIYYMRENPGGGLVWLGISGDGGKSWSNIYHGIVGGGGRTISTGAWVDIPLGAHRGQGELGLTRKDANTIVAHRHPGFGGSEWRRLGSDPLQVRMAGNRGVPQGEALTGIWSGDDGGTYYIRENRGYAGIRQISWAGLSRDVGKSWTNVFFGAFEVYGDTTIVSGPWIDVPRGAVQGGGTLRLQVKSKDMIVAIDHKGFGGSVWRRTKAIGRSPGMSTVEQGLFDQVNAIHQQKCGVALKVDTDLINVARAHNLDLARNPGPPGLWEKGAKNQQGHYGSDGSLPADRIQKAVGRPGTENSYVRYYTGANPPPPDPNLALNYWREDPPHLATMQDCRWKTSGLNIVVGQGFVPQGPSDAGAPATLHYYTQSFAE